MASIGIDESDKKYLSYLGRATDVTTSLEAWMETADDGKLVRSVKDDHSNVEARSPGKRKSIKRTDASKSTSFALSANAKIGAGPTIPVSGKGRAGFSRSRKNRLVKLENVISIKKLIFKDDTLLFPTEFERDMCKYVVEWLKQHESSESHSTSVRIGDGSDHVKTLDQFIDQVLQKKETLDDLMGAIDNYTTTQSKATHYVSAITLGAKKDEIMKNHEKTTEIDGGGDIEAGNIAGVGATGGRKVEEKEATYQGTELGNIRIVADSADGEAVQQQLAIVRVKITRISGLVQNPYIKCLLNTVIDMYQERKKEIEKRGLIGPVRILCDDDGLKVYWRVATDNGAEVIGTTNKPESSQFYFEDKGNGIIYILYYTDGKVNVDNRRVLAVQRSHDANPLKIIAVKRCKEPYRLEFEMKKFEHESKDKKKMTVDDWLDTSEFVYLRVRSAKRLTLKRFWPKFYIEMKEIKIQGQPTKYEITFLSEDEKKSRDRDSQDDLLLFRSEKTVTDDSGELQDHTRISLSGGSCKSKAESITSVVAVKPPSESESKLQVQSDSSSTDTEIAEISEYPSFEMLVSEDYVFPDLYITQEEEEEGRVE